MAKRGRAYASYRTSTGEEIQGLSRLTTNRWRISQTGEWFTEPDEFRAVQKAKEIINARKSTVTIPITTVPIDEASPAIQGAASKRKMVITMPRKDPNNITIERVLPGDEIWAWLRKMLIEQPEYVAKMVGLPELAGFRHLPIPEDSLVLEKVLQVYLTHGNGTKESKRLAENTFREFMKHTQAKRLSDLTTENLKAYRVTIKDRLNSPGSVAAYFGRVKNIIRFAKSEGLDPKQIDQTLSAMAILKAPQDHRTLKPTPITRENYHAILAVADKDYPDWKPRLLVMLNCCLHFGEMLDSQWADFDLEKATYCSNRNKKGKVVRAATLWDETVEALEAIKRTNGPYVFTSKWGSKFNAKGQWKSWEVIRTTAKLPELKMDDIRDGAYTAACNAVGIDEKLARLLAGHRSHGLQDNYVQRNPAIVKPACDAVYLAYGPFTVKKP